MNGLESVRKIISMMNGEERKVARSFLTALSTRGSDAPSQSLQLFDLLEQDEANELKASELKNLLYSTGSNTAFVKLILRLRAKLYESLLLSVNLEREGAYSERGRALHEIRRNISLAQVLITRGLTDLALTMLDDCISRSEKLEHYEELLAALRVRLEIQSVNKGQESLDQERSKYTKIIACLTATHKAVQFYHELTNQTEFKSGSADINKLKDRIEELQAHYELTGSATVAYYQHYLETHLYQEVGLFKNASNVLKRQAELVEVHPALHSKTRLAGVYVNLAWNQLYTRKFASALTFSAKAREISNPQFFNHFQCYDTEFYAHFYRGEYDRALKSINHLLKHDVGNGSEYRVGKREFQKASVLFVLKEYENVRTILNNLNPIENDIEGWNLALRVLHIMNDIELERTENAFNRVENMRKHLYKLKKKSAEIERYTIIYEILKTLVNTKYDFVETRKKKRDELLQLTEPTSTYRWKIISPELIIFEQWFESKVFKQQLKLSTPPYDNPIHTSKIAVDLSRKVELPKSKFSIGND